MTNPDSKPYIPDRQLIEVVNESLFYVPAGNWSDRDVEIRRQGGRVALTELATGNFDDLEDSSIQAVGELVSRIATNAIAQGIPITISRGEPEPQ